MTLVIAIMLFAAIAVSGTVGQSYALFEGDGDDAKIFKKSTGDVVINNVTADGLPISLSGDNYANSFTFVQDMYMDGFAFEAHTNLMFDTITLTVTGKVDTSSVIDIIVEKGTADDGSQKFDVYGKKGTEESETLVTSFVPVDAEKTEDTDMYTLSISYDVETKKFTVNGTTVEMEMEFEYNVANMVFKNSNKTTDDEKKMELLVKSIANANGVQQLSTNEGVEVVDFVFWTSLIKPEGTAVAEEDKEKYHGAETAFVYNDVYAKAGSSSFNYPISAISIIGDTIDMEVFKYLDEENEEGETVETQLSTFDGDSAKTSLAKVGEEGTKYEVRMYSATEVHIFTINAIKDEVATELNIDAVKAYIEEKVPNGRILTSKTYSFPNLKENGSYKKEFFIFSEEDKGIDSIENVKIKFGYKKPESTSDWSWSENFTVTYDTEGRWAFAYKVVDSSGNEGEKIYEFSRDVVDNTPPTVTVTEQLTAYKGVLYTISAPTADDNAAGVDTSRTEIKVYKGVRGSEDAVEVELYEGNSFIPDEITPEGEDYTYFIVYIVYDFNGNSTKLNPSYSYVTVEEPVTPEIDDPVAPAWLTWILIIVSVGLIIVIGFYIVSAPKDEKESTKAKN